MWPDSIELWQCRLTFPRWLIIFWWTRPFRPLRCLSQWLNWLVDCYNKYGQEHTFSSRRFDHFRPSSKYLLIVKQLTHVRMYVYHNMDASDQLLLSIGVCCQSCIIHYKGYVDSWMEGRKEESNSRNNQFLPNFKPCMQASPAGENDVPTWFILKPSTHLCTLTNKWHVYYPHRHLVLY